MAPNSKKNQESNFRYVRVPNSKKKRESSFQFMMALKARKKPKEKNSTMGKKPPHKEKNPKVWKNLPHEESSAAGEKKRKRRRNVTYKTEIFQLLKQISPDLGMSSEATIVMNLFVNDVCMKLAEESSRLTRYSKTPTITSREIETAVRLVLPEELAKHAISEGTKAVNNLCGNELCSNELCDNELCDNELCGIL